MPGSENSNLFDAYYYAHDCGTPYQRDENWLGFFDRMAEKIVKEINPGSVLDAGCAMGFLVEALRKRGVEAWGIDISEYAINQVHQDIQPYCQVGSILEPLDAKYNLITNIEVLEHMQKEDAEKAIHNLCNHTRDILFSSTPFDYAEATHFNVQPPEYWAAAFARHNFLRDVDFDASFITQWAVRFQYREQPLHQTVYDYERRFWPLNKENLDLRKEVISVQNQLRDMEKDLEDMTASQKKMQRIKDSIIWKLTKPFHGLAKKVWGMKD